MLAVAPANGLTPEDLGAANIHIAIAAVGDLSLSYVWIQRINSARNIQLATTLFDDVV